MFNSKLHLWHPDNLESFARDCFQCGKELLRLDRSAMAEKLFALSNQAFDMAAGLRLVLAETGETDIPTLPVIQWDATGTDTVCGRFAVGVSTGGFFGIAWGPEQEPVDTSETLKTADEARAWCEERAKAAGVDTPVTVEGTRS